jgi:hypothetical protein
MLVIGESVTRILYQKDPAELGEYWQLIYGFKLAFFWNIMLTIFDFWPALLFSIFFWYVKMQFTKGNNYFIFL